MTNWIDGDFSEMHARAQVISEGTVLLMVLHFCSICDEFLPNVPPQAEHHRLTLYEYQTQLNFNVFRVNDKGNIFIHRNYGKLCNKCK